MTESYKFQQTIDNTKLGISRVLIIISICWFFLSFNTDNYCGGIIIAVLISFIGIGLDAFANPKGELEIRVDTISETFPYNDSLSWNISVHDIKEIEYKFHIPAIVIILSRQRPFNWNKNFKLHTGSDGKMFYQSYQGELLPTNTIEIRRYDNLKEIHTLIDEQVKNLEKEEKLRLEEIEKERQIRLEQIEKEENIRKQQEVEYLQRLKKLEDIQEIDPIQFEITISTLFKKMGYEVITTKASRDEGIDLIITKNEKKSIVQCKRYTGSVGQPVVRDLYGSMIHNHAEDAYLVTTGIFSLPAQTWALGKPIHLVDGKMLIEWIENITDNDS